MWSPGSPRSLLERHLQLERGYKRERSEPPRRGLSRAQGSEGLGCHRYDLCPPGCGEPLGRVKLGQENADARLWGH